MILHSDEFTSEFDVSRETLERLDIYAELLKKWNPAINLVSKKTIDEVWSRHMLDSAQISKLVKKSDKHWVDLGSGGGFPGMVAAILATDIDESISFTLIESDKRKSVFLRTVARETGVKVVVHDTRIESTPSQGADILTARALAPLDDLLEYCELHLKPAGRAIFPKGMSYQQEIVDAEARWDFSVQTIPSMTDAQAVLLEIKGISRV
ncbi:MAG: 16S rRNA (guanine(527)-N(7))-methyltransferase RsmG [Pseudoruegeria sp.]